MAWFEQPQRYLMPLIVLLILVLLGNAIVMAFNMSRQAHIEDRLDTSKSEITAQLRDTKISEDLRAFETQQLRVQATLNEQLQKLVLQRGCPR